MDEHTLYSEYTAHTFKEYFGTASTRSTRSTNGRNTASTDVQNPEILEKPGVCNVTNSERVRVRKYPQYITLKYCECTKYMQYFFSKVLDFTPRYWEHLWKGPQRAMGRVFLPYIYLY